MTNWTTTRKWSFWVHLTYIVVPALAAIGAGFQLWSWVFGSWVFSVPLILCLEGVAALGFYFHLRRIDSPFVQARHFIPFYSVGTLGYELGAYLVGIHGYEIGIPFTLFVVAVFGFLFVKSFGVLERLMIDPVEAAREKATELTQSILIPIEMHAARAEVFRDATVKIQAAEGRPAGQPQLTLNDIRAAVLDVLGSQPVAVTLPRIAEVPAQPTFTPPQPAVDPRDLVVRVPGYNVEIGQAADGSYGHWDEAWMNFYDGFPTPEAAAEGLAEYCRQLEGPRQEQPELPIRQWEEDEPNDNLIAAAERFRQTAQPVQKAKIPVLDDLLAAAKLDRAGALALLAKHGVKRARDAYSGLRLLGKLPSGMTFEQFEPLYAELTAPAEGREVAVTASEPAADCRCDECDAGMTSAQKGVAVKWAGNPKRKLMHESGRALILCGECRAKRA